MAGVKVLRAERENVRKDETTGGAGTGRQATTYLASDGESSVAADDAVGGRRRGSWRRLETPASLLKEALDLLIFWLLEKLLFCVRLNILGPAWGPALRRPEA